jgi:hypothetical protein
MERECAEILKNSYFSFKSLLAAVEDDILDENRKKRGSRRIISFRFTGMPVREMG